MKRALLDTNILIEYFLNNREILACLADTEELILSPVVLGEFRAGLERGGIDLQGPLHTFLAHPFVRQVSLLPEVSEQYALLFAYLRGIGHPIPTNDLWIAAHALSLGAPLMTLDRHFVAIPNLRLCYPVQNP